MRLFVRRTLIFSATLTLIWRLVTHLLAARVWEKKYHCLSINLLSLPHCMGSRRPVDFTDLEVLQMAKKKKPAANPNRGVATTSIASKPKPDTPNDAAAPQPIGKGEQTPKDSSDHLSSDVGPTVVGAPTATSEKEVHELSPDELEKRLEDADLQRLVEKHAAKTARDASRYTNKLQTDHRTLRKQAQSLYIRSLLPDELIWQILDFAREGMDDRSLVDRAQLDLAKDASQEEEMALRFWTLERTLLSMGFTQEQSDSAIDYLLEHPPPKDHTAAMWGLDQAHDWLLLNEQDDGLPVMDDQSGQAHQRLEVAPSTPQLNTAVSSDHPTLRGGQEQMRQSTAARKEPLVDSPPSSVEEFEVSDLDSDLEPDELLSRYLSTKARLFEEQPDLIEAKPQKQKSKTNVRSRPETPRPISHSIQKLQRKVAKIEGDALFDRREADFHWTNKRMQLLKEAAETRKNTGVTRLSAQEVVLKPDTPPLSIGSDAEDDDSNTHGDKDEVDDDAIGNLFAAEPSRGDNAIAQPGEDASNIVTSIRDFGKPSGVSPRRILEDACRARDPAVRLKYKLVSVTAFSNRHTLVIQWSKNQHISYPLELESTTSQASPLLDCFTMQSIATPDERQSEGYVSVVALFQIFSTSPKEEKLHLRLSPTWRDLYLELVTRRKIEADAVDRDNVRKLRDKVRSVIDSQSVDGEEDVVHTTNFKKRVDDQERSRSRNAEPGSHGLSEDQLRELWQQKSGTPAYQQMLVSRKSLPMFSFKEAALAAIENNQVTIICGETGCGKSTQMPAFILEHQLHLGKSCKIYCTEPRRISAITLAQRVSQELGERKGDIGTLRSLIGFAIRLESQTSRNTRLVYATTGIVLRMLESGDGLKDITHIVIDEVHERSIETDFLLIILRSLMTKRPELKVILMSATVNSQRFASYFNGAPVLNVPGRTYEVEQRFLEDAISTTGHVAQEDDERTRDDEDIDEVVDSTTSQPVGTSDYLKHYDGATRRTLNKYDEYKMDYELIMKLVNKIAYSSDYQNYSSAVLIFLPGIGEIRALTDMISASHLARDFTIYPLHSAIPSEDQQRAFDPPPRGMRKIVISTNIAETGVTIPDVTCVIDTGKHREMRFDERRQISRLIQSFISQANAKQRRGRAGRVQPGLCFHLFTRQRHDTNMSAEQTPEMLRLSLQDLVMRVKICKLGDIQTTLADALDPPSSKNVRRAIDALIEVGALTAKEDLTPLGQQLSKLPLDPYLGKLVLHGTTFSCLDVSLTLAAILTSKPPFTNPLNAKHAADAARAAFAKSDSDLLTDFNAYAAWRRVCTTNPKHEAQFCRRNFLSSQNLAAIEDLKAQFLSALADGGIVSPSPPERHALSRVQNSAGRHRTLVSTPPHLDRNTADNNPDLLAAVIAWSFYPKLLTRDGKGWRNISSNQSISVHPTSILRNVSGESMVRVKFLSFYSILQSSHGAKNYNASSLTPVAPLALVLLAGEATFLTYAGVIIVDNRIRFCIESGTGRTGKDGRPGPGVWKTILAIKALRRRLEEVVEFRWRKPGRELPGRLRRWWEIWERLVGEVWAKND